jgi:hypothetical protein
VNDIEEGRENFHLHGMSMVKVLILSLERFIILFFRAYAVIGTAWSGAMLV